MFRRTCVLLFLMPILSGCGGGNHSSDKLVRLRPGAKWVYQFTGNVVLPSTQGGGQPAVSLPVNPNSSTVTVEVSSATAKDANNATVNILDRKFDLLLVSGARIQAVSRIYFTQVIEGVFVHGFNNSMGTSVATSNDRFVPSSANPPFAFLYFPDPAYNGVSLAYTNPFSTAATGGYSLQVGSVRQPVNVPAGDFVAKPMILNEGFSGINLTSAWLVPDKGIISGTLQATLADGTQVNGTIALKQIAL